MPRGIPNKPKAPIQTPEQRRAKLMESAASFLERRGSLADQLRKHLNERLTIAENELADFANRLTNNALNAFEYGDRFVHAAARQYVAARCLSALRVGGVTVLINEIQQEVERNARDMHNSSSQCHNVAQDFKRIAWVEAKEEMIDRIVMMHDYVMVDAYAEDFLL